MSSNCVIPAEWEDFGVGPLLGIDYLRMYHCSFEDAPFFFTLGILALVVGLIWMLGHTAGNYLSPSLAKVCEKLNLSYNVAGVTFLAFGNGAPDVFSSVSAFSGSENAPLIGINGMLGSAMFVATIVVGTISIMSPCYVSSKIFIRDVCFFIIAAIAVNIMAFVQTITTTGAACLFLIYLTYVSVVLIVSTLDAQKASKEGLEGLSIPTAVTAPRMGDVHLGHDFKVIQTAFWHKSDRGTSDSGSGSGDGGTSKNKGAGSDTNIGISPRAESPSADKAEAYTFLILDDTSDDGNEEDSGSGSKLSGGADDEEALTINLSGGLINATFDGEVIEDYVGEKLKEMGPSLATPNAIRYDSRSGADTDGVLASGGKAGGKTGDKDSTWGLLQLGQSTRSPLTAGLLSDGGDDEREENTGGTILAGAGAGGGYDRLHMDEEGADADGVENFNQIGLNGHRSNKRERHTRRGDSSTMVEALYWQQWFLQHRIRKQVAAAEWWSLPLYQKVLTCFEFPANFLRDASIPTLQPESWSKPYAVAHPIVVPLVCLWAFQNWHVLPVVFCCLCGALPAVGVYLMTHTSKPPTGTILGILWVLTAFFMCIVWIYMLAGELIVCLEVLGYVMEVPSAYLGLTVLAWGNCIGDWFTMASLARRGMGEMAVAGCYASPVFDVLFGLGLACTHASLKLYPEPFVIQFNTSAYISLAFLYLTLISTLIIVSYRGWKIERGFGYYLIALYLVYQLVQMFTVIGGAD